MSAQSPNEPPDPHRRRPRPSYGLPGPEGPTGPAPGTPGGEPGVTEGYGQQAPEGAPGWGTPEAGGPPQQPYGQQQAYGAQQPHGQQPYGAPQPYGEQPPAYGPPQPYGEQPPAYGPPQWGGQAPLAAGGYPPPAAPEPKRKGVWQLIVGILLFLLSFVVAIAMFIGSISGAMGSVTGQLEPVQSGATFTLEAGQFREVAIASSDVADGATCTVDIPANAGIAQPLSTPVSAQLEGQSYEAVVQVGAFADTEATVECTGTTHPIGLMPAWSFDIGMMVGALAVGTVMGLVGLGLTIWGIIALVRSGGRIKAWREGRQF